MSKKVKSENLANNLPRFIKLPEVAEIGHCSVRHVQVEIQRGNLKAYKPGKELLFRPEDVEKWILKKAV